MNMNEKKTLHVNANTFGRSRSTSRTIDISKSIMSTDKANFIKKNLFKVKSKPDITNDKYGAESYEITIKKQINNLHHITKMEQKSNHEKKAYEMSIPFIKIDTSSNLRENSPLLSNNSANLKITNLNKTCTNKNINEKPNTHRASCSNILINFSNRDNAGESDSNNSLSIKTVSRTLSLNIDHAGTNLTNPKNGSTGDLQLDFQKESKPTTCKSDKCKVTKSVNKTEKPIHNKSPKLYKFKFNNNKPDIKLDDHSIGSPGRSRSKHELAAGYGFNEDQIGVFEETFQIFDKDSDGFITLIEIRTVMNSLGFFPCDDIIRKSIENIDNDNSGTVDFEEFICMMSKFRKIKNNHELDEELMEIFKIFDRNQDGYIDKEELKDVLIKLGENITDEEVAEMIKEADIDGDSKVSFTEFRSILHDNRSR